MPAPDPAAKATYDALIDDFEAAANEVAASTCSRAALHTARTQLSIARRVFRVAALQAPAEGETHKGFDRSLDTIRQCLAIARRHVTPEGDT